jgi:signal peptidase I
MFLALSADLLDQGYLVRFHSKGESMHPTIKDGETVTVEPVEPVDVKRGDIILYKSGVTGGVIAHRVIKMSKSRGDITSFVLRGDASQTCDLPIAPEQVLGRVVSIQRQGRNIELAGRRARLLRAVRVCAYGIKARAYSALELKSKSA